MTAKTNTFEGGTNGTAITAGNSGAASGDPFSSVTGAPTFSAAAAVHGTLGMSAQAASGLTAYVTYSGFSATTCAVRFYYTYTTTRSIATILVRILSSGALVANVRQSAAGNTISFTNASNAVVGLTGALTVGVTYRIEASVLSSAAAGTLDWAVYVGDSTTPAWSGSGTGQPTNGGPITDISFGKFSTTTDTAAFLLDDIAAADGTLTPIGVPGTPATGTSALTVTAAGAASAAASGAATLAVTASATARAAASGTSQITLAGTGTAAGAATGASVLTVSATGVPRARGTGTASIAIAAAGTATVAVTYEFDFTAVRPVLGFTAADPTVAAAVGAVSLGFEATAPTIPATAGTPALGFTTATPTFTEA